MSWPDRDIFHLKYRNSNFFCRSTYKATCRWACLLVHIVFIQACNAQNSMLDW